MKRRWSPIVFLGACVAVMLVTAVPASAQVGSLQGRVVDEAGKPVPDAEVTLEWTGDTKRVYTVKTNSSGRWVQAGLWSAGGRWNITVRKGDFIGHAFNAEAPLRALGTVDDIVIIKSIAAIRAEEEAEVRAEEEMKTSVQALLQEVVAAIDSKNHQLAIAKLTEANERIPNCYPCYLQLGTVYRTMKELDKAEEALKKALEINPQFAEGYDSLAALYALQNKLDLAAEASAKADELYGGEMSEQTRRAASISAYNAGVNALNTSNPVEARVQFERAIKVNPEMADAYFQLGMSYLVEGTNVGGAVKPFEKYLELAPTGDNAAVAKDMLNEIRAMLKK